MNAQPVHACLSARHHAMRAIVYGLLLLSPIGAPALGLLVTFCPNDRSITPDGPFALAYASCGLSGPLERYLQSTIFLPLALFAPLGMFALPLACAWIVGAFCLLGKCLQHAIAAVFVGRRSQSKG